MSKITIILQNSQPEKPPRLSLLGYPEVKLKRPCTCGYGYAWAEPRPDTIHHAALHCQVCNKFNGWQPKPQANGGAR
jgi:hypothetical protein